MERGGHIAGWKLSDGQLGQVAAAMSALANPDAFHARYGPDEPVMLFAVGDGNHSLATAKECYERQKRLTAPERWADLPARFALCELVNLHDDALDFEPIHRVVFHTDPQALLDGLVAAYPGARLGKGEGHLIQFIHADGAGWITLPFSADPLPVGALQLFLDHYLSLTPAGWTTSTGTVWPGIWGCGRRTSLSFCPVWRKTSCSPQLSAEGRFPAKTFSMGHAMTKRFYLEARKIRD